MNLQKFMKELKIGPERSVNTGAGKKIRFSPDPEAYEDVIINLTQTFGDPC